MTLHLLGSLVHQVLEAGEQIVPATLRGQRLLLGDDVSGGAHQKVDCRFLLDVGTPAGAATVRWGERP